MLLRQLIDYNSNTYTYLLADTESKQACLIDPVLENNDQYLELLSQLDLQLKLAIDTHVHADHITGLGQLRDKTGCCTMFGQEGQVSCASEFFHDNSQLELGNLKIDCWYTPGHTNDSYCFVVKHADQACLFSGDTLLIRGTGRTDFQNGCAHNLYNSLRRLLELPDDTVVYPGHDYNGRISSTIGEERRFNQRILIEDIDAFAEHMANLNLPDPKMMDVAVSANQACGEIQPPSEH